MAGRGADVEGRATTREEVFEDCSRCGEGSTSGVTQGVELLLRLLAPLLKKGSVAGLTNTLNVFPYPSSLPVMGSARNACRFVFIP